MTKYVWTGAVDNNFSTAGNWDPAGVPGRGDVAILNGSGSMTITDQHVGGLNIAGNNFNGSGTVIIADQHVSGLNIVSNNHNGSGTVIITDQHVSGLNMVSNSSGGGAESITLTPFDPSAAVTPPAAAPMVHVPITDLGLAAGLATGLATLGAALSEALGTADGKLVIDFGDDRDPPGGVPVAHLLTLDHPEDLRAVISNFDADDRILLTGKDITTAQFDHGVLLLSNGTEMVARLSFEDHVTAEEFVVTTGGGETVLSHVPSLSHDAVLI